MHLLPARAFLAWRGQNFCDLHSTGWFKSLHTGGKLPLPTKRALYGHNYVDSTYGFARRYHSIPYLSRLKKQPALSCHENFEFYVYTSRRLSSILDSTWWPSDMGWYHPTGCSGNVTCPSVESEKWRRGEETCTKYLVLRIWQWCIACDSANGFISYCAYIANRHQNWNDLSKLRFQYRNIVIFEVLTNTGDWSLTKIHHVRPCGWCIWSTNLQIVIHWIHWPSTRTWHHRIGKWKTQNIKSDHTYPDYLDDVDEWK